MHCWLCFFEEMESTKFIKLLLDKKCPMKITRETRDNLLSVFVQLFNHSA